MVKLSQLPSSQLLEVPEQSITLSLERQGSGPKAKAEVIELRNKYLGWADAVTDAESSTDTDGKGESVLASRSLRTRHFTH